MTASDMQPDPWEVEGRRLAPQLDGVCAVIVASADPRIAPRVALGIARTVGAHRRVAIADLIGEAPVLESLLDGDDPHGLSDSFFYGVSLNKIARPLRGAENVFLMPSGSEPVDHEGIYANERWRRLAAGFHQVGALLIVVARPGTNGFADLCGFIGTLMPVGEAPIPIPPGIPVINVPAYAPPPRATPSPVAPPDDEPREQAPRPRGDGEQRAPRRGARSRRAREQAEEPTGGQGRKLLAMLAVAAALITAGVMLWPRLTGWSVGQRGKAGAPTGAVAVPAVADSSPRGDSAAAAAAATDSASADSVASPPAIVNPADSTSAARFAVYFMESQSRSAAIPDERMRSLPAVALSSAKDSTGEWFRLTIGASASREAADSLLTQLRSRKLINSGSIRSVPFAFRLEESVAADVVAARLGAFEDRGLVVYALRQADGSATLYTGAFASPVEATALADSLRGIGIAPVLAYRLGRAF